MYRHVLRGILIDMSQPELPEISEFLTYHDKVILSLGESGITVLVPGLGRSSIKDLSDLPALLADPTRFDTSDPRETGNEGPSGYVLKTDPALDLYLLWSDRVDNALGVGTRAELLAAGVAPSRLLRADRHGTSAMWPRATEDNPNPTLYLGWDDNTLIVHEQDGAPGRSGILTRDKWTAFAYAKTQGDEVLAGSLLDPFEDDPENEN